MLCRTRVRGLLETSRFYKRYSVDRAVKMVNNLSGRTYETRLAGLGIGHGYLRDLNVEG